MTLEQGKTHISADPVPEAAPTDPTPTPEDHHPVLDRWVFGIAAAIVLAFIAWGVSGTDT